MTGLTTIVKGVFTDKEAFHQICESPKWNKWGLLVLFLLGAIYGSLSIRQHLDLISSFESDLLRLYLVPAALIVFGLFVVFLTRIGLTLLLWAASRGFGGPGNLGKLYRGSIIALTPIILAMPAFIANTAGLPSTTLQVLLALVGLAWLYILCVNVLLVTQQFATWKGYAGGLAIFIFFLCIYYIVLPPAG